MASVKIKTPTEYLRENFYATRGIFQDQHLSTINTNVFQAQKLSRVETSPIANIVNNTYSPGIVPDPLRMKGVGVANGVLRGYHFMGLSE